MSLRVGLVSAAHVHTPSYAHNFSSHPRTEVVGVWDDDASRGKKFASDRNLKFFSNLDELLALCDAVAISSENMKHRAHIEACAKAGKAIICEKPVVPSREDFEPVRNAIKESGVKFMTAFPCRFSPAWSALKARLASGEIGAIRGINATNRGTCPGSWFTQPALSGGGAMIDHVVHVADLLRDMLGSEPDTVYAQIGNKMYGQEWDDTAMVSLEYPGGVFATLDSSWSRPASYKTWGDVTMKIVGDRGVINLDMFGQGLDHYRNEAKVSHVVQGFGSDLDGAMIDAFVRACLDGEPVPVTLEDGLAAVSVSLRAYESTRTKQTVGA